MEKQKIFILFTGSILPMGGLPLYNAGKAMYLEKTGWKVYIVFEGSANGTPAIPYLSKYVEAGCCSDAFYYPPYRFNSYDQEKILNFILQKLDLKNPEDCEIIIESHGNATTYWGELLAAKIGARHFMMPGDEYFRCFPKVYSENLDFCYFKWKRKELIATKDNLPKLFNGYKNVTEPLSEMPPTFVEMYPIQDVDFPKIDEIEKLDWNICHVGRIEKTYVPYIIEGVGELARRYPGKKINFIFVGDVKTKLDFINQTFRDCPNVTLTFLGFLFPIPRILFSKIDVVSAISQSAIFTANDGVLTITGSTVNPKKTPGLLGYDVSNLKDSIWGKVSFTYLEILENVLVKHLYDKAEYKLPKLLPEEHYYNNFWKIVENADPKKEYYFDRLSQNRIRQWVAVFPFGQIGRGTKVIFVGATEIATDYRRQVETQQPNNPNNFQNLAVQSANQFNYQIEINPDGIKKISDDPYCEILATVDEHPEDFDDTVQGFERLKQTDYDAIVITTYTWQIKDTIDKVLEIVPQMADRIICNLQFMNVYWAKHKEIKFFEE